ncbi:MAG: hypothetical protein SGI88_17560 [Candidatus Hydrogenedentes bacterium]|nr:hypothetical protein [Candidatus Hydrogenedentota bacterium]
MKPKVGLLLLYLKLYDDTMPEVRSAFTKMLNAITAQFIKKDLDVVRVNVCRVRDEYAEAVAHFESEGVDLIVSVHLAYSPSLESAEILARTQLPLLMLDTTVDARFTQSADPIRLMYNHGIHGVQDLASVLRRMGKRYEIVAGHYEDARIYERAASYARGALAAKHFRNTKALRIGDTFPGMGDFAVEDAVLQNVFGIHVDQQGTGPLADYVAQVREEDIQREYETDCAVYEITAPVEAHRRSIRVGLGLRQLLDDGGYSAFSMNFLAFNSAEPPLDTVPFMEASKAMSRGIGYAGEGDVLTAALVGALQRAFSNTTFTEIFCPDWKAGSLFISHMGEVNPQIAANKPRLCEKDFPWTPAKNPAIIVCAPKPGNGTLVSLAPGPGDSFGLVVHTVRIEPDYPSSFQDSVRGWITPGGSVESFLEHYSLEGATHHCALLLGEKMVELSAFADISGMGHNVIRCR